MDERYEPETIDVAKDAGLTITYHDGYVARFDLVTLRLGCPCATCRGLRDRDQDPWPRPGSPQPLRIVDAAMHGAWISFATTGDPGWPAYDLGTRPVQVFGDLNAVVPDPRGEQRALWEGVR